MEATESILNSTKLLLGIQTDYKHFDSQIVAHINSVFSILTQLGIGPENGFQIFNEDSEWSEFIEEDFPQFALVKSYMFLKVRLLFDPPTSSAAMDALNRQIGEFEWRLKTASEFCSKEDQNEKEGD